METCRHCALACIHGSGQDCHAACCQFQLHRQRSAPTVPQSSSIPHMYCSCTVVQASADFAMQQRTLHDSKVCAHSARRAALAPQYSDAVCSRARCHTRQWAVLTNGLAVATATKTLHTGKVHLVPAVESGARFVHLMHTSQVEIVLWDEPTVAKHGAGTKSAKPENNKSHQLVHRPFATLYSQCPAQPWLQSSSMAHKNATKKKQKKKNPKK